MLVASRLGGHVQLDNDALPKLTRSGIGWDRRQRGCHGFAARVHQRAASPTSSWRVAMCPAVGLLVAAMTFHSHGIY
jgi:hypothetical protein